MRAFSRLRPRPGELLRHREFVLLGSAQTVSKVGTRVTFVALPLVAVIVLEATAFEVGLLTAAETVAFLVLGLPAGAWIDRLRRRPVLVLADELRAVLLVSVPVAVLFDVLTMA